jgi:hypothetical protein
MIDVLLGFLLHQLLLMALSLSVLHLLPFAGVCERKSELICCPVRQPWNEPKIAILKKILVAGSEVQ